MRVRHGRAARRHGQRGRGRSPRCARSRFRRRPATCRLRSPSRSSASTRCAELEGWSPLQLEAAGRLTFPIAWREGETHFRRIGWDEALDLTAAALKDAPRDEVFFYGSGRSSNEAAFLMQTPGARLRHVEHQQLLVLLPPGVGCGLVAPGRKRHGDTRPGRSRQRRPGDRRRGESLLEPPAPDRQAGGSARAGRHRDRRQSGQGAGARPFQDSIQAADRSSSARTCRTCTCSRTSDPTSPSSRRS